MYICLPDDQIVAGTLNVYNRDPNAQIRGIQDVITFVLPVKFDLAIIRLDKEFQIVDGQVKPIQLPTTRFFPPRECKMYHKMPTYTI